MWLIDQLAERAIDRARERGELDNLPNEGRPLQLDDDSMVPPELRAAYRLLKNAGYLPEEVKLRREIRDAEQLLREARTEEERDEAGPRLRILLNRLGTHRASSLLAQEAYYQQLRARVDTGRCSPGSESKPPATASVDAPDGPGVAKAAFQTRAMSCGRRTP